MNTITAVRTPPHNIDAEEALIACCIIDAAETLSLCHSRGFRADAFYRPAHQLVFRVIESLQRENVGVDQITLSNALAGRALGTMKGWEHNPDADKNLFEYIGGHAILNRITSRIESTTHAQHWLDIVFEKWAARRLIQTATNAIEGCYTNENEFETFLDGVEREILSINQDRIMEDASPLANNLPTVWATISARMRGEASEGISTGFRDLDRLTFGLHKDEMIVLAARPSMGKTSLAMNIAENVACPKRGEPDTVLVHSLEMSSEQLAMRMLCHRARVNTRRVRDGTLSREDEKQLQNASAELNLAPILVDDAGHATVLELRAKARRQNTRLLQRTGKGLSLIVIDYLQLISGMGDSRAPREQQISEISRGLKSLAKELHVPVLVLSQLNREAEKENRQPRLSDLRESGSIEQDADVVLLLAKDKESEDKASVPSGVRKVDLIIAKQRNGPVGTVNLTFIPEYTSFENFAAE